MKEQIEQLIKKKEAELRNSVDFSGYGSFISSTILDKVGKKYGIKEVKKILDDNELSKIALTTHQIIPEFLNDFISLIKSDLKPKSILDPWTTKESYAFHNDINSLGYCINPEDYRILNEIFKIEESRIKLGDNASFLKQEKDNFDFIVSFPPFGLRPNSLKESLYKDVATDLFFESSKKLKEDGYLGFLMSSKFAFDKKIKEALKSKNIFIQGLFYLPEGSHLPIAGIKTCFVLASKIETEKTFVSELSTENKINEVIFENFKNNINGKTLQLGKLINFNDFTSYKALSNKEELTKLGKRTGNELLILGDIATVKTIKDVEPELVKHTINSIYIPKVGVGKVVNNPNDFLIKPKNYLQVTFNDKYANSTYMSKYFNTHIGRLGIESCKVGVVIESLSVISLLNCVLFIPSIDNQLEVIKVDQDIEKYSQELIELQDKLWKRPSSYKKVSKEVSKFVKDKSIVNWLDDLPFPLSSILWKYQATTDNKNKIEHLFHFFEAFSEFTSLIMLSAFNQNKEFYKSESHRWVKNDPNHVDWIKKASFGGWNNLTANLSKSTRILLNNKDNSEIIKALFGNPTNEFFDFITNKGIFNVLNEVREYRNKWKGHGGVSSKQENKNRVIILEQKLTELRKVINDGFSDFKLISAGSSFLEDGVNVCTIRELVGIRTPFNQTEIMSLIQLDVKKLYFMFSGSNKPIEMLPFIKYNQENKACYFYSSIESNDVRWISFHYEKKSEISEVLNEKFGEVLELLNSKKV
jgi:hypothetical protein